MEFTAILFHHFVSEEKTHFIAFYCLSNRMKVSHTLLICFIILA
uniref:Uncharacterized protein n=1 Tax=Anguilla anguilla TaxID=7936 RepID=A0A0E9W2V9_ANGAN